jgi:hypothetical protein
MITTSEEPNSEMAAVEVGDVVPGGETVWEVAIWWNDTAWNKSALVDWERMKRMSQLVEEPGKYRLVVSSALSRGFLAKGTGTVTFAIKERLCFIDSRCGSQ